LLFSLVFVKLIGQRRIQEAAMGARDKGGREARKPKKDAKKIVLSTMTSTPPPEVEVIRKKRKPNEAA